MFKIIEKTKIWFSVSLIIIIIGMGMMCFKGLNYGIDFAGGSQIIVQLNDKINKDEVDKIVKDLASDAVTNTTDKNQYEIKSKDFDSAKVAKLMSALNEKYGLDDKALVSQDEIGASVGKDLTRSSFTAISIAFVVMLAYIAIRFEWKFGIAALLALVHDILITLSIYAIFRIPVNTPFIAAILTVVGYSINDTIVIFDRIREDNKHMRRCTPDKIADKSINETLKRSVYTSISTLITIVAVNIFVPTVREFTIPLIVGVSAGAYSSIFIASPIWVILKEKINKKSKKELKTV